MQNFRKYGTEPFKITAIHVSPGTPGETAPVAKELSGSFGTLETLQTASSLEGQIQELYEILKRNAGLPIKLIGWSWGALLSFIFTARYPEFINKLIIVSSAVFEEKYVPSIMETRLDRMDDGDMPEYYSLINKLNDPGIKEKNYYLAKPGKMISRIDSCDPLPAGNDLLECQFEIYQKVSDDCMKLRKSGELIKLGRKIKCPVVAIHGDYDPHPTEGIKEPLSKILNEFRFILLKDCGHHPWLEKNCKSKFYKILTKELL